MAVGAYTGNLTSGATLGLPTINGTAPFMVIVKNRTAASESWRVYHEGVATDAATDYLSLNDPHVAIDSAANWNDTAPSASVVTLGNETAVNASGQSHSIMCFWETNLCRRVLYTGNNSTDGAFWYGAGEPAWVLQKASNQPNNWGIHDSVRDAHNPADADLIANGSNAEDSITSMFADFLATGFKCRSTNGDYNGPGYKYIGVAFVNPLGIPGAGQVRGR